MAESTVFEYKLKIRESHLDTFGHVNNAIYLSLFEEARWEIITERGFGLKQIQERQVGPIILDVKVQFRREIKNRENVLIRTQANPLNDKIASIKQIMLNEKREEACIAEFTVGLFDMKARRLIPPTQEWRDALGMV